MSGKLISYYFKGFIHLANVTYSNNSNTTIIIVYTTIIIVELTQFIINLAIRCWKTLQI